jgi:glycosyltransferase involved in cell wall biosynthesis
VKRQKLSVYVLTYNEEVKIRDCLESVTWADEIIILDSFSTDGTVEICRKYTDKIFQHKFAGFGNLRNTAIGYTQHDWVLSVDADERVTGELRDEILDLLNSEPEADAYFVPRINYFLGHRVRHCGWYPDYRQPQLFNKRKMKYNDQLVHEGFTLSGKASYLKEHVIQYPFLNLGQFFRKMENYSSLRSEDMFRAGKRFHLLQMFTHPLAMFFRIFVLKRGFLDGRIGLIIATLYGYYTLIKYLKLWELGEKK